MKTVSVLVLMLLGPDSRAVHTREFNQPDHASCVAVLEHTLINVEHYGPVILTCKLKVIEEEPTG